MKLLKRTIFLLMILMFSGLMMASLGLLFYSWSTDYSSFCHALLDYADKLHWKAYFQEEVFPIHRFYGLRYALLGWVLLLFIFLITTVRYWKMLSHQLSLELAYQYGLMKQSITSLPPFELRVFWAIISLFVFRSIYHMWLYELEYDEAWTYIHFVSKGPLLSMVSPNNNHILYSVLGSLADYLPIEGKYSLRIPNLMVALLTLFSFFAFVRRIFNARVALLAMTILAFTASMNLYAILARGYGLQLLATLWATGAMYLYIVQGARRWLSVYGLALVVGTYAIPTFIYLALPMSFIGLLAGKKPWLFIRLHFLLLLLLLLLFSPLFLSNGLSFLTKAASKHHEMALGSELYWFYLHRMADWLLAGRRLALFWAYAAFWGLLLLYFVVYYKQRKLRFFLLILLIQLAAPVLFFSFTKVMTPYRTWCYEWVFLSLGIALVAYGLQLYRKKIITLFTIILVGSLAFLSSEKHYLINWSAELDREAKQVAHQLLSYPEIQECYSFSRYDKPLLQYYFLRAKRPFRCWMPFPESKDYRDFEAGTFQAILLETEEYEQATAILKQIEEASYLLIYENQRIQLYIHPHQIK